MYWVKILKKLVASVSRKLQTADQEYTENRSRQTRPGQKHSKITAKCIPISHASNRNVLQNLELLFCSTEFNSNAHTQNT